VLDAMRYALLGGGKRLRPCLTLATAEAVAVRDRSSIADARSLALPAACAIEFIHSYSLVHDDLPAMDNDTLRRGRPTTHVAHGEGMAILAGDGLLTEAFAILSGASALPAERQLRSIQVLAGAAGPLGMVGGQALDLAATVAEATALRDMHARKTGALIRAAATLGAIAAGADTETERLVDEFARDLGLAFQILDDVLDVEGSSAELGKTAGKDAHAGKPTYPALFGIERSRALAGDAVSRAKATLERARLSGRLTEIADWSLTRRS
jgi:geranylgeranyl pyrophosphate synthase